MEKPKLKPGDKLYCFKNYQSFKKDNWYTICNIGPGAYVTNTNLISIFVTPDRKCYLNYDIEDKINWKHYFKTKHQARVLKLKQLYEIESR